MTKTSLYYIRRFLITLIRYPTLQLFSSAPNPSRGNPSNLDITKVITQQLHHNLLLSCLTYLYTDFYYESVTDLITHQSFGKILSQSVHIQIFNKNPQSILSVINLLLRSAVNLFIYRSSTKIRNWFYHP